MDAKGMSIYRYSINSGDNGGCVLAGNAEDAKDLVRRRYPGAEVTIWDPTEDEFFDPDYPGVIEAY